MPVKLGPHAITPTAAGYLWAGRANITKQAFGVYVLRSAQSGAITVCRPIHALRTDSGAEAARDILRRLDSWGGYQPSYVELWNENEAGQRLGQGLERRVQLTAEAVQILHAAGIRVAGFSFSTGVPEPDDWAYIRANGFCGVDAIALHEYWGNQGFSTWNALRYRRVHDWLGGSHPPFIVTECGRDAVEGGAPGWRISGISGEAYVNELLAYDAHLSADAYVLGATVFTTGGFDTGWGNFDVDELVGLIIGTGPPPTRYSCVDGICVPDPGGPYATLAQCQAACVPPGQATAGFPWALFVGLGMGAVGAAVLLSEYLGVTPEIEMHLRPGYRLTDVQEIDEDQPVPPGYQIVG